MTDREMAQREYVEQLVSEFEAIQYRKKMTKAHKVLRSQVEKALSRINDPEYREKTLARVTL